MANKCIQDAGHVEKVYTLETAVYVNKRLNELGIKFINDRDNGRYIGLSCAD